MNTKGKEQFLKKLEGVKLRLPDHYGILYRTEFPQKISKRRLYDVVQGKTVDWDVLEDLKLIVKKYNPKKTEKV